MKVVLFRHAHKGVIPFEDPELTARGFEQAENILKLVQNHQLPTPTRLFVSPKRRTSQTFYRLAKEHQLKCEIKSDLDQHLPEENSFQFRERISRFLNTVESECAAGVVIFICTHFDWIEEAMLLINSNRDLNTFEFSHWAPTQFIEFDLEPPNWKFVQKGEAK